MNELALGVTHDVFRIDTHGNVLLALLALHRYEFPLLSEHNPSGVIWRLHYLKQYGSLLHQKLMTSQIASSVIPSLKYSWQATVAEAITEFDRSRLPDRIIIAERAVETRACENSVPPDELQAIRDARNAINVLKTELGRIYQS